jgi:nitrogen fixation NifU-like protein
MSDLTDLYQELILDHNRRPRNRRKLEGQHRQAEGYNPLCGDRVTVYVRLSDGVIEDVAFEGSGCAISTASASLMTESLKGRTIGEARALFERFRAMVTEATAPENGGGPALGKLKVFSGVRKYPARVKCATLAWHTATAALDSRTDIVTTE